MICVCDDLCVCLSDCVQVYIQIKCSISICHCCDEHRGGEGRGGGGYVKVSDRPLTSATETRIQAGRSGPLRSGYRLDNGEVQEKECISG